MALADLKRTEAVRAQLEQKLRQTEARAAELVLKCDLHKLNGERRIRMAQKLIDGKEDRVLNEAEKQLQKQFE